MTAKYKFTEDMSDIAGKAFGDDYENACRAMVIAGIEWFDAHPNANPMFKGMKGVMGLCVSNNEDATALEKVIEDACPGGSSGAMFHAAVNHAMYAFKHGGWEGYVAESKRRKAGEK